jgi:propionyl-CoA carboxylase alpha chain
MIKTLLVANRGEIARRIFRTCRSMGIATVAVYSDADADAPFVREADTAVALGGLAATDSYLRTDLILAAAQRAGADAIHPGYGFLSENAAFAEAVAAAGLTWVGPTAANIRAMGLKIEAKQLAAAAGVPILPSAVVGADRATWLAAGADVGYPLLVKASAGGGGKGMRSVFAADDLVEAIEGAQREASSSFGDGTVFLERLLVGPRHIEVQVFGDTHGNVVHLHERECSIQRRHQKIVEEAPSSAVSPELRARMGAASVGLAAAIGYVGAGTVEYLLDASGEFFFLEMNTRLQVEHPVTECITGLDLVAWQLRVDNGEALPLSQSDIGLNGHAIEVRLYAEDPANNFMPSTGKLHRVERGVVPAVRWDSGVESGSVVSPHYDPMLAKVISHAPTRTQAAAALATELRTAAVHGVVTNAASLAAILSDDAFLNGDTTTAFLDQRPHVLAPGLSADTTDAHLAAVIAASVGARRSADGLWGFAPAGWRNVPTQGQLVNFAGPDSSPVPVTYTCSGNTISVTIAGRSFEASVRAVGDDRWSVTIDGLAQTVRVHTVGATSWANSVAGQSTWDELPRFVVPSAVESGGGSTAPVPGRIVAVQVSPGDAVEEGQVLVVLEAMKMEHSIRAPQAATVAEVRVAVGDQVDARQVLVVLSQ